MALIKKEIMIHADSAFGDNLNDLGSSFTLDINPPLLVPENAVSCDIAVDQATVQYTFPNLSVGSTTDNFVYTHGGSEYTHAIPEGIYALQDVVDFMNRAASSDGVGVGDDQPLFSAIPITSTQKVALGVWHQDESSSLRINMFQSPALASILRFYSDSIGDDLEFIASASTAGTYEYQLAPNVATFSALSYFRLESSLPIKGVDPRGLSSLTLAVITPDVSPGSQLLYRPFNLIPHDAKGLIGAEFSNITFSLKNNSGALVSTLGESWSIVLRLSYMVRV